MHLYKDISINQSFLLHIGNCYYIFSLECVFYREHQKCWPVFQNILIQGRKINMLRIFFKTKLPLQFCMNGFIIMIGQLGLVYCLVDQNEDGKKGCEQTN